LVTSDQNTMTRHFRDRVDAGLPAPGVFVLPQQASVGEIIESLLLVWAASEPNEWPLPLSHAVHARIGELCVISPPFWPTVLPYS
jgi:hypothetical protein